MELIAIMPLEEAKDLQRKLAQQGVEIELNHSRQTCTSGCRITIEVWAKAQDFSAIENFLHHDFREQMAKEGLEIKGLGNIYNSGSSVAQCPACGHQFSPTQDDQCPECGLCF